MEYQRQMFTAVSVFNVLSLSPASNITAILVSMLLLRFNKDFQSVFVVLDFKSDKIERVLQCFHLSLILFWKQEQKY